MDDSRTRAEPVEPGQLAWLASQQMTVMEPSGMVARWDDDRHAISPTVANRLRTLLRQEARLAQQRIVAPNWSRQGALPGLIVAQRYVGGDAFGAARQTAELDAAFRRAAGLMDLVDSGERPQAWPRPIRPERGGLWLIDATYGSVDLLWSFYGTLVSVATSTPVSLASFASLAWSASRSASRMASRWTVRSLEPSELAERPSAASAVPVVSHGDTWEERTTKRLIPIFKLAVSDGRGIDYKATGPSGEIRLIVPPRASDEGESGLAHD